jgi:hypothetical protein
MKNPKYAWLVLRALCELARYEAIMCLRGFGCVQKQLSRQCVAEKPASPDLERAICDAISWRHVSTGSLCSACSVRSARFDCSESMEFLRAWLSVIVRFGSFRTRGWR